MSHGSSNGAEGAQDQPPKNQEDLLPLDFQDKPQKKPLPLGAFIKKSGQPQPPAETPDESASPVKRKPIPLVAKKVEADASASPGIERKPIPLVAKKVEAELQSRKDETLKTGSEKVSETLSPPGHKAATPDIDSAPATEPEPPPAKPATPQAIEATGRQRMFDTQPKTFSDRRPLNPLPKRPSAASPVESPSRPKRRTVKLDSSIHSSSLGHILREARAASGLSISQVEGITRIKKEYLDFLESDKADKLPPPVFVNAYVRTLTALYKLDSADVGIVQEKLKNAMPQGDLPESLLQEVEKTEYVNLKEDVRLRRILAWASVAAVCLVVIVAGSMLLFRSGDDDALRRSAEGAVASSRASSKSADMECFVIPQSITMRELKIPSDRTR